MGIIRAGIPLPSLAQPMSRFSTALVAGVFIMVLPLAYPTPSVFAEEVRLGKEAMESDQYELDGLDTQQYEQEGEAALPDGYNEDALQRFSVDGAPKTIVFAIDTDSIRYGAQGAIHYILVATSQTGVSNAYYESMRCDPKQYRTHGYTDSSGKFRRAPQSRWMRVQKDPWRLREALAEQVMCDYWSKPRNKRALVEQLKGLGFDALDNDAVHTFF